MIDESTVQEVAEELVALRSRILKIEATMLEPLKDEEEKLRIEMLRALHDSRIKAFKTEGGVMFTRAYRTSYVVTDALKALPWAQKNDCLKVDTVKLGRLLKGVPVIPQGIEMDEVEFLQVRSNNNKGGTTEE